MTLRLAYFFRCLQCATALTVTSIAPGSHAAEAIRTYDWVPVQDLTDEQRAQLGPSCRGAYVDPLAGMAAQDHAETPIEVEANSSDMSAGVIELEGDVEIAQGARVLRAQRMYYNRESGEAALDGEVEIRQPGIWIAGDHAGVDMGGNEAKFSGGEFVLHEAHMRGAAGSLEHRADGVVVLENGEITSCEPGNESWLLRGEQLKINPSTMQGYGEDVSLRVGGIPVFYTPYIWFPVGSQRQTGFLFPVIGTSEGGPDITQPWYWNIAPNMDATAALRYASGRGTIMEGEYRYLNHYSENRFVLSYLNKDQGGGDPDEQRLIDSGVSEELIRPYKGEDRWLMAIQHSGGDVSSWYSNVDYSQVSDIDYFRDLSVASFDVANNTYLSQGATFGYRLPNWLIQARIQDYQTLLADVDETYRQVPRLNANAKYPLRGLELSLKQEYVKFNHEDPEFVDGDRVNLDYQLNWNRLWSFGFLKPNIGVQALAFNFENDNLRPGVDDRPMFVTPYASLDTGLIFERDGGNQTFEPRLFYLYRAYEDQSELFDVTVPVNGVSRDVNFDTTPLTFSYNQLFREHRFSGGDRLDDANQLTLGLTSTWYNSANRSQSVSASVGQIFYFEDRKVLLSNAAAVNDVQESDMAAQISAAVSQQVQLHTDFLYNPKAKRMMRATAGVAYRGDAGELFNFGYRYVREEPLENTLGVDQLDTSFAWPVGNQWNVVGRVFYDLDDSRGLDTFIGFEYDDCCYRVRLLARRWLDSKLAALVDDRESSYDDAILLEVDLKGLASSGESITRLLSQNIPGFGTP